MGWKRTVGLGCGGFAGLVALGAAGLVAYAYATADARLYRPDQPLPSLQASTDPAVIAQGRELAYGSAHCSQCHSAIEREDTAANVDGVSLAGGIEFAMGPLGTTYAANLTSDKESGIGARTDAQLARAIQTGILHDGRVSFLMQLSAAGLSDEDTVAIISFLRTLEPTSNPLPAATLGAMPIFALFLPVGEDPTPVPEHVPPAAEPSMERGKYLAEHVMLCAGCHSDFDMSTFRNTGAPFAGGMCEASHETVDPDMEYCPPNLTSSPVGVTGQLDEAAFVARMRQGRVYATSIMPWENFSRVSDADLRSVYRYIKAQPPSDNNRGPSYRKQGWKAGDAAQ